MFARLVRTVLNRRTLPVLGAFLLVAAVAGFLVPQPTEALGKCGLEFTYYDSSWNNVVGWRAYTPPECGCYLYSWGVTSPYREIGDFYC